MDAKLRDLQIPLTRGQRLGSHPSILHGRVTKALPVYYSLRGKMAHRVRGAEVIYWRAAGLKERENLVVDLWCGQSGRLGRFGRLVPVPPEHWPLCGTCEGRAVGAGYPAIAFLQQRYELLYTPREGSAPAKVRVRRSA